MASQSDEEKRLKIQRNRALAKLKKAFSSSTRKKLKDFLPNAVQQKLKKYQIEGILKIWNCQGRAFLADDMGLGKSVQSLCAVSLFRDDWPLLIVCPASLRMNWIEEIERWIVGPVVNLHPAQILEIRDSSHQITEYVTIKGLNGKQIRKPVEIVICSYAMLKKKILSDCCPIDFKSFIVDESHMIRTHTSNRSKNTMRVSEQAKRVILLTGTPALHRPQELHPQFYCINPTYTKKKWRNAGHFKSIYGLHYSNGGPNNPNFVNLRKIMENKMGYIRRLKSDVLGQMPPIIRTVRRVPANILGLKKEEMEDRKKLGLAKIGPTLELLETFMQSEKSNKVLVFVFHIAVLDNLQQRFNDKNLKENKHCPLDLSVKIKGEMPQCERTKKLDKFRNDRQCRVAFLSLSACHVGLNLTCADYIIFVELPLSITIMNQAESRAHRMSRGLHRPILQVFFIASQGGPDEKRWGYLQNKQEGIDNVVDGARQEQKSEIHRVFSNDEQVKCKSEKNKIKKENIPISKRRSSILSLDVLSEQKTTDCKFWVSSSGRVHLVNSRGNLLDPAFNFSLSEKRYGLRRLPEELQIHKPTIKKFIFQWKNRSNQRARREKLNQVLELPLKNTMKAGDHTDTSFKRFQTMQSRSFEHIDGCTQTVVEIRNVCEAPLIKYIVNWTSDGYQLCLFCRGTIGERDCEIKALSHLFCSTKCHNDAGIKANTFNIRRVLFDIDGGKCIHCKFDAQNLYDYIKSLSEEYREQALIANGYTEETVGQGIFQNMILNPQVGRFWQGDHIREVAEGGGLCGIDNLQTLCAICHRIKTNKFLGRRVAKRKRNKKRKRKEEKPLRPDIRDQKRTLLSVEMTCSPPREYPEITQAENHKAGKII